MSQAATEFMTQIGKFYIQKGCPNHRTWWFEPGDDGALVFNELYGIGVIKLMGTKGAPWQLTDMGQQWVMTNCQD